MTVLADFGLASADECSERRNALPRLARDAVGLAGGVGSVGWGGGAVGELGSASLRLARLAARSELLLERVDEASLSGAGGVKVERGEAEAGQELKLFGN